MKNTGLKIRIILALSALFIFTTQSFAGSFPLTGGAAFNGQNYVQLSWDPSGLPDYTPGAYSYTIHISEDGTDWQTCSANYNKPIRVLNVYPDIAGSEKLKSWMETGGASGPGLGLISVDLVTITAFNANPDSYLKDAGGDYLYDVVMLGTWDRNADKDLSVGARDALAVFIQSGRGMLFGHDTAVNQGTINHQNINYLVNNYLNMLTPVGATPVQSTIIVPVNTGFLLRYPWDVTDKTSFTVPNTHASGQVPNGIIWMQFNAASTDVKNYYLTTWNNVAMIQTGHSNGASTLDEQKIIANTLFYLAQFTDTNTADVHCVMDAEAPNAPVVTSLACNEIGINSKDNGVSSMIFVKATEVGNLANVFYSDTISNTLTAGLAGYFISEDNDPAGVPSVPRDEMGYVVINPTVAAQDDVVASYPFQFSSDYIHIQAVDKAGNLGDPYTVEIETLPPATDPTTPTLPLTVTPPTTEFYVGLQSEVPAEFIDDVISKGFEYRKQGDSAWLPVAADNSFAATTPNLNNGKWEFRAVLETSTTCGTLYSEVKGLVIVCDCE